MHKFLLFACLVFCSAVVSAQQQETLFGRNGLDMSGVWYSNTNNFSLYEDNTEYFSGGSLLFEFNKDFFMGWSWQRMQGDAPMPRGDERFDLKYSGFQIGFAPFSHRVLHPTVNVLGGSGRLDVTDNYRERIFVLQPAAGLELNVFKWFRLGAEAGYRFVADVDHPELGSGDISSPFAQLQFRFGFSW